MYFQGRQARKTDFADAQQLIPDRFLYDRSDLDALFAMWLQIIDGESGYASVITGHAPRPLLAFGVSVALKPDFYQALFAQPHQFVAARIFEAWKRGDSPIMSREEVANANAAWGVDVFVLHHGYAPKIGEPDYYEAVMALAAEFIRQHAGLNLRSLTQEFYDNSWIDLATRFGFTLRHDFRNTFLMDVRRSDVLEPGRGDFPTNTLFASYPVPRLQLDAEQRRSLRAALESEHFTDGDGLVDGIYDRIAGIDTSLATLNGNGALRDRVISWVRSHPEELHPYLTPAATP